MRIIYLFVYGLLLFLILFLMLCSCKKNKLNKILKKIFNKLRQLLNNMVDFLNVDDDNSSKNRGGNHNKNESDFPMFLGPNHNRF